LGLAFVHDVVKKSEVDGRWFYKSAW